ncbi:MAG: TIM44-like domain-containing protein [Betaproteobacteria bacterium]
MLLGVALVVQDADARRFGGSRSFGRQSPNVTQQQSQPPARSPAAQQAPTPQQAGQPNAVQPPRNRWLGPIAGLAAGLGIAALLSHFGMAGAFGEMLSSMLMIGLLVFAGIFIWRMLRSKRDAPAANSRMEPAYGAANAYRPETPIRSDSFAALDRLQPGALQPNAYPGAQTGNPANSAPWGVPDDFDVPAFLRSAKVYYNRLQAAWDAKNLADIREFTTPEVYGEIKTQIDEEPGVTNRTEVFDLDAQMLGIEPSATDYLASVRFSGKIKEDEHGTPQPFVEVWNLVKPKEGRGGWLLAGVQQVA